MCCMVFKLYWTWKDATKCVTCKTGFKILHLEYDFGGKMGQRWIAIVSALIKGHMCGSSCVIQVIVSANRYTHSHYACVREKKEGR